MRRGEHAVARSGDENLTELPLCIQVDPRRPAAEVAAVCATRAVELVGGGTQQVDQLAVAVPRHRSPALGVVEHAEHPTTGVGWIATSPVEL